MRGWRLSRSHQLWPEAFLRTEMALGLYLRLNKSYEIKAKGCVCAVVFRKNWKAATVGQGFLGIAVKPPSYWSRPSRDTPSCCGCQTLQVGKHHLCFRRQDLEWSLQQSLFWQILFTFLAPLDFTLACLQSWGPEQSLHSSWFSVEIPRSLRLAQPITCS